MKLKNRKTGETLICDGIILPEPTLKLFNSLAELNAEWEDVTEGPKDFWYIDDFALMCGTEGEFTTPDLATFTKKDIEKLKAIGNYFETKEEAEQAVNKLKAFKRLKDTITCIDRASFDSVGTATLFIRYKGKHHKKVNKDLGILLGGEE